MRSLTLLAILACFNGRMMADCNNSTLLVRSNSGANIKVYIDGETGQNPATPAVTVQELTPGSHQLKVVAVYTDENGQQQRQRIYNGTIDVKPSSFLDAHVEEHKGVAIHREPLACGDQPGDMLDQSLNADYNPAPANSANTATDNSNAAPQSDDQQPASPPSYQAPPASYNNLPPHISDADFYQLKNTVINTQYEMKKLDTLKALVKGNQFATSQVADLMNLFTFESNKLAVAKLLYDHTVDKQNYGTLASNFNFDARKEDFKKFMASK